MYRRMITGRDGFIVLFMDWDEGKHPAMHFPKHVYLCFFLGGVEMLKSTQDPNRRERCDKDQHTHYIYTN